LAEIIAYLVGWANLNNFLKFYGNQWACIDVDIILYPNYVVMQVNMKLKYIYGLFVLTTGRYV